MGKYNINGRGIVNSIMSSGRNNKCTVNGVTIDVPSGASVSVQNGKVFINGKEYTENGLDNKEVVHLAINVTGDVRRVDSECDLVINGNVVGDVSSGMSIDIEGNVEGSVRSGMSVDINGNQTGSVSSGMSTTIKNKIYK
ncbi:MAG: hypothetical protein ACRCX8_05160 [Sarcina sp.]